MKATKLLPILAVVLCVPGIALRALHLLNGFDVSTGLPTAGDKWIWFVIALFAISAIVYAVLALPLKTRDKVPFEQLIGTKETLFRMAAACRDEEGFMLISGVTLLVVGQAAANMLMVCGCLPVIGVPLSFISYGGTSMVVSLTALGMALSVYKAEVKREKREELLRDAGMPPIMPTSDLRRRGWRR